ncbi:hypothetical protein PQX77_000030 [Marasmius sp. AFHP31]|nr:hypothetical protein PQX77_000030 [Marasmius sp. AFHP31]
MADLYPPSSSSPYPSLDNAQSHSKSDSKPQATFLTKLYALLERPENHHMIRWDPQGEHIIVERPEQLALHVLPSIYRQSRFASFSRQLNIYGFMRKVNLRNVDPAIDDPDASTWSHPTLNRHSPPDVVANFKRRVPPRLPKPRKRDLHDQQLIPPPRSAISSGGPPSPSKMNPMPPSLPIVTRARGFSAPGSFTAPAWATQSSNGYPRSSIQPLTVPDPSSHSYQDDPSSPTSPSYSSHYHSQNSYASNPYPDVSSSHQWFGTANGTSSSSLSSLLNPSTRPTPTINTSVNPSGSSSGYGSPFSSMPLHGHHHQNGSDHSSSGASPLSPDGHSRPHTAYSMNSMSYEDYPPPSTSSRPGSSHRHSPSPRPPSSSRGSPYHGPSSHTSSSFRGRARRHSQAPYPIPYDSLSTGMDHHSRPSTSPQPHHSHHPHSSHNTPMGNSLPRVRSMIQLPSVETTSHYSYSSHPSSHGGDFAYSPVTSGGSTIPSIPSSSSISSLASVSSAYSPLEYRQTTRPGTSASSISQTSSSQANTPPLEGFAEEGKFATEHGSGYPEDRMGVGVVNVRGYGVPGDDTFGFAVNMDHHEHLTNGYGKSEIV